MLGNFIARDGATWMLREPDVPHYSTHREGGHLFLHARRDCSRMTDPAVELSPRIVRTLWEKDVQTSATAGDNDVEWCETCATKREEPADQQPPVV